MIFNDTSSEKQGIVQSVYFGVSANATTYPITDVARESNESLDVAVSRILAADGHWQFDDTNATDLPRGRTDIISGQQDYSFDEEYLAIIDIIVVDANGNEKRLIPIDNADMGRDQAITSFENVSGTPIYYDKIGESILLYPKPNYNMRLNTEGRSGLIAYFQRKISYFSSTDTTKEPGYAKHLHPFTSFYAQWKYAKAKGLAKATQLEKDVIRYMGNEHLGGNEPGEIKRWYTIREKDLEKRIQPSIPYIRKGWK